MKNIKILLLVLLLVNQSFAFSIKDIDKIDRLDREDYIKEAKQKANSENFSKAYALLKKAKKIGLDSTEYIDTKKYIQKKQKAYEARLERERKEKARLARLKKQREERERQARLQRQRQNTNYGLAKSQCYLTSKSYALHQYCTRGSCDGFSSDYDLYQLCKYNNVNFYGSNRNTNINLYLNNGGSLSYDYFSNQAAYQSGSFNGTFQERKNYILYLLSGFQLSK